MTVPSPSMTANRDYNGPFIGRARALVDYTPSPYDRDALRFKVRVNVRRSIFPIYVHVVLKCVSDIIDLHYKFYTLLTLILCRRIIRF